MYSVSHFSISGRHGLAVRVLALVVLFLSGCSPESSIPSVNVRFIGGTELLQALVKAYNRAIPSATFSSTIQRPGAIGAVDALETGHGDAALTGAGVAYTAFTTGTDEVPYPHKNLRGVAVLSVNALHLVTRPGLPFHQITDLRGKTIAIGPQGSNTEVTARKFLPQFGISDSHLQTPASADIPRLLADKTLDAHLFVISYPSPAIAADLAVPGTQLVSIRGPEVLKLRETYPYLRPIVIPAGTYAGQTSDIETVGVDLVFVCRADLSAELVYKMLAVLFDSVPELLQFDSSVGGITLDRAPGTPIPLHPGAARFYRERGLFP
jgi:TRAP transporter TAXI family solute receptor